MIETEVVTALKENLDAAEQALEAGNLTALRALAAEEARLMDNLRAIWASRSVQ